jgi:hypothetical protein
MTPARAVVLAAAFFAPLSVVVHAELIPTEARESVGYIRGRVPVIDNATGKEMIDPETGKPITREKLLGTAFAGHFEYPGGEERVFLITAKHVVFANGGKGPVVSPLWVVFNRKTGGTADRALLDGDWLVHESEGVDLAVFPGLPTDAAFRAVSNSMWLTDELVKERGITVGDDVFFTGLLPQYPGASSLQPITRFGKLALIPERPNVGDNWLHYLDAQNMSGHSGAPVFLWATQSRKPNVLVAGSRIFALYGVVVNVLEYSRPQIIATDTEGTPVDFRSGGVTGVVPVCFLWEIIESDSARVALKIGGQPDPAAEKACHLPEQTGD